MTENCWNELTLGIAPLTVAEPVESAAVLSVRSVALVPSLSTPWMVITMVAPAGRLDNVTVVASASLAPVPFTWNVVTSL